MRCVYKYHVALETFDLMLPEGTQILHVDAVGDDCFLWAIIDSDARSEKRTFRVFGTGYRLDDEVRNLHYIGTALAHGGALVWHVFEVLIR